MKKFFCNRILSITYVFKGMLILIRTEDSIKAQLLIFVFFSILGLYFNISVEDWKWQLFCFALIFSAEGLNTAIEKLCNFIHPDYHKQVGFIKDISAGAVGFSALFSLTISILIYIKYVGF